MPHVRPTNRFHFAFLVVLLAGCSGEEGGGTPPAQYVGRASCGQCHEREVAAYAGSDHDRAMDHATEATVLGDFNDTALSANGFETRLAVRDGRFLATLEGAEGIPVEVEVRYVFGVRPLQQYLVDIGEGRVQVLPWSWDTRPASEGGQRWFHIYGDDPVDAGDLLHWTRPSQNWNRMCADCHSTNLDKGYDHEADRYTTSWSEIDVSCEACHGPASRHVEWASSEDAESGVPPHAGFPVALVAEAEWRRPPGAVTASRVRGRTSTSDVESCARCHAHRSPIAPYEAGMRFYDAFRLSLPRAPLYHADGQVREEVFVYGSFLQSRMAQAGVGCGDCHDPHTAGLRAEGNALCTACHEAETFDTPTHHKHSTGTDGSSCVSCHMPETTFMQVDARRDHSFRVPRLPAAGEPNACLGCHSDEDEGWLRTALADWTAGESQVASVRAATLADAEAGRAGAAEPLRALARDRSSPAIVRAVAVSYLEAYPGPATREVLADVAGDPSPLVRAQVARAARGLPPAQRGEIVLPLAADSTRVVRISAARALAPVPQSAWTSEEQSIVRRAAAELLNAADLNSDDPAGMAEVGDYHAEGGRSAKAEGAYRRSLRLEPAFVPAALSLAELLRSQGRVGDERATLSGALDNAPETPLLLYAVALHEVRAGRLDEAAHALSGASTLDPSDARFPVAHALVLQREARSAAATQLLETALPALSDPTSALLTLIDLYRTAGQPAAAAAHARTLADLHPADPRYRALLDELTAERNAP